MPAKQLIVISASRRTDIPAFYMPWFMDCIARGYFEIVNPYNRRKTIVSAGVDQVHSIVFWSKNFGPFIAQRYGQRLAEMGYGLFFNFTINSEYPELEPNVPPLSERLDQLERLCRQFGARAVAWRFDPICFFCTGSGPVQDNLHDLKIISTAAANAGVTRCITSFYDDYRKVRRRLGNGFRFVEPSLEHKQALLLSLSDKLAHLGIALYACCEKKTLDALGPDAAISPASCIPNDLLADLYGPGLSRRADPGQRRTQGCGCKTSVDIGVYDQHPCFHNCLFCYANPSCDHAHSRP